MVMKHGILKKSAVLFFPGLSKLPVIRGRHAFLFAEDPAEIQGIVIPNNPPDLRNVIIGSLQKHLCIGNAP